MAPYFIFVRQAEELFTRELYGEEAYNVIRHVVFYRPGGKRYTNQENLSLIMKERFGATMNAPIGVSDYRHLAAGLCRVMIGITIDQDENEDPTHALDNAFGHSTRRAEHSYGIVSGQVGRLNDRTMAVSRAGDKLWQHGIVGLSVPGNLPTAEQLNDPDTEIGNDGILISPGPSSSSTENPLPGQQAPGVTVAEAPGEVTFGVRTKHSHKYIN